MNPFFTRFLKLTFFILVPGLLIAQTQTDYNLLLHSGKFIPAENINTLNKNSEVFAKSLFAGNCYVVIQFNVLPTQAEKERLKAGGIELIDYIPNLAYTANVSSSFSIDFLKTFKVRSIINFNAVQKTAPGVLSEDVPTYAIRIQGFADVSVISYEKTAAARIIASLGTVGATIVEEMPMFRTFTIRVPQSKLQQLADLPWVQWVEFIDPPVHLENTLGRTLHRVNILNDGARNLKGDGVNVGIWDEGEISPHLDFSPTGRITQVEFSTPSQHSTHCAGTILGRGLINQTARGMAPNASLFSYDFSGNIQTEMANAIPANNLVVSSHSYGGSVSACNINGAQIVYSTTSRNTDVNLNNFPNHLHVHSAGNSQGSCAGGWFTITGSGKTAKNNILVANITTTEGLSGSSSCGPTQDGRVKPEISAFGTSVFSTSTPLNAYATLSGTSMATPGVAGSVTLLVQRYKQLNGNTLPPSSLIKNTILNTAHDLGNPGPDYRFGYGRINALEAVKILEENRYAVNTITTGSTNDININVPTGAVRLRVLLNWNDPAGAANANPALVNNLDLSVINGATTTLPWILDPANPANPATRGVDAVSNIEQVTIDNPVAGSYTLRVNGASVPTGPSQTYSLTWSVEMPFIEVIYPAGGESFNPGLSETITWNNAGVTSNQTVEYSLDGGSSWTVISSSVAAGTTRLSWTVPAANTSAAIIRVTSGSLSDMSSPFKILGTVTGFAGSGTSCNAGEVNFTWNAVANATHYDIYRLDGTGNFVLLSSNITGTSHTATGLTPGASMWFTIRAKNNTTSAESERTNAINVTVSNGGGGIGPVGAISGLTSICGNPSGISYSVSPVTGATSYTWTAPPGASIATGQGTNSVTINYPPGSTNGNVSVFASAGSCSSAPASLAVTLNAVPSAPSGGGNQSQNVCLPAAVPTLTATATVPAGHTVVWYNAATGGSVVSSPVLNSAGSVTYYAESVHTASGCRSVSRTAVTLTITTVAQASVNASGATTFCEGGTVTLTANAGASYNWSNGATTQAITASTTGTYSVTVTSGGCTSTSPATNVLVNPIPSAIITAGGALAFCQGGSGVSLTASAGASWLWSNGATTQSINATNTGNYTVIVTSAAGCSATSAITSVAVSPNPTVNITATPYTRLFPGLTTTLTANVSPAGSYNYTWYKDNVVVSGATSQTLSGIDPYKLGSYTVTVTNTSGLPCSNTSPAIIIADSATTKLFVLPNPNNGRFDVVYHSTGTNTYMLKIYDSKGSYVFEKAYTISAPYQRMEVNMRTQGRKGIYHIVLIGNGGKRIATGKVLIQ